MSSENTVGASLPSPAVNAGLSYRPRVKGLPKPVAEHLGGTAHLSPLLRKVRRLGLTSPHALLLVAVTRGCRHYAPADLGQSEVPDPGREQLSNAELAIALICGAQEYDPQRIRCAAQLLGSPDIMPSALVRLARMERCVPVLGNIARSASRLDEANVAFWEEIVRLLPPHPPVREGVLPHPSRYTLQRGYSGRQGAHHPHVVWLGPTVSR